MSVDADLGFAVKLRKCGEVEIWRGGQMVTLLRPPVATRFISERPSLSPAELQQRLARLTRDYKRGNERQAKAHGRNSDHR